MKRAWQIFVAPGDETLPLPIEKSPWNDERWVSLPREHWNLILEFAGQFDPVNAEKLRSISYASDNNKMDYVFVTREEISGLLMFVDDLAKRITNAPPLISEVTEDIPDLYANEEYVRMLRAVAAVFQEAMRLQQPFRAWIE